MVCSYVGLRDLLATVEPKSIVIPAQEKLVAGDPVPEPPVGNPHDESNGGGFQGCTPT
jgi:hypothetical protein